MSYVSKSFWSAWGETEQHQESSHWACRRKEVAQRPLAKRLCRSWLPGHEQGSREMAAVVTAGVEGPTVFPGVTQSRAVSRPGGLTELNARTVTPLCCPNSGVNPPGRRKALNAVTVSVTWSTTTDAQSVWWKGCWPSHAVPELVLMAFGARSGLQHFRSAPVARGGWRCHTPTGPSSYKSNKLLQTCRFFPGR